LRLLTEHAPRGEQLHRILQLDPVTDCAEIYRITALFELPWEMQLGHNLGYYQTLAAPRIAALLVQTQEIERRPRKRAYDTGLLMYELFTHGFDHPQGRAVVRRLNQLHRGHDISNEDFLYVLAAFAVVPTRFINRYGWRRLTAHETTATWAFYAEPAGRPGQLRCPGSAVPQLRAAAPAPHRGQQASDGRHARRARRPAARPAAPPGRRRRQHPARPADPGRPRIASSTARRAGSADSSATRSRSCGAPPSPPTRAVVHLRPAGRPLPGRLRPGRPGTDRDVHTQVALGVAECSLLQLVLEHQR